MHRFLVEGARAFFVVDPDLDLVLLFAAVSSRYRFFCYSSRFFRCSRSRFLAVPSELAVVVGLTYWPVFGTLDSRFHEPTFGLAFTFSSLFSRCLRVSRLKSFGK